MNNKKISPEIKQLITRGVRDVMVREELIKELTSGNKLRVKFGVDATGPKLHLGRAMSIWRLKMFQDLGHQVVFLIGDFTTMVGDASDKQEERKRLTIEEIKENMKTYIEQAAMILNMDKVEVLYNSEWLSKLDVKEIIPLTSLFSVHELIKRENFNIRFKAEKRIGLHEFLYPLLQGYDSVAVKADVEVGGRDQIFNVLAGRRIQEYYGQKPQNIITNELLDGLDGRKMSTSWGNGIFLLDSPDDKFGKIMSMKDEMIGQYFEYCTFVPAKHIEEIQKAMQSGANPRDFKLELAFEIVKLYHGQKQAEQSRENFINIFQNKKTPKDIPEYHTGKSKISIMELLKNSGLVASNGEARRLISQKGIKINEQTITDQFLEVDIPSEGIIIRRGKLHYLRVLL